MIFLLNLRVVVLFLLTPRYMQPVLTPKSVVQESQPIWMLLQNGQTVGACSSAPKLETWKWAPAHREAGNHERCSCSPGQTPPSPRISHEKQAIMDGAHQRRARNLFTYDWCFVPTASATSRDYSQGNFHRVPFDHAWNMRPKFGVEDELKPIKTTYKIHFARDMGFACLHYRLDSTLWFCSTRWDQVWHRRTYAHFFPDELQQLRQGSKNLFSNTRQGGSKRKVLVANVAV